MTKTIYQNKLTATTLSAAFTDHNAVRVQLRETHTPPHWGRPTWKLNTTLLQIDGINYYYVFTAIGFSPGGIKEAFRQQWERLRSKQTWYRTKERWWEICAKSGIKRFFKSKAEKEHGPKKRN